MLKTSGLALPFYDKPVKNDLLGRFNFDMSIGRVIVFDVTSRQSFDLMLRILKTNHLELSDLDLKKRYLRKIHIIGDLSRTSGANARER